MEPSLLSLTTHLSLVYFLTPEPLVAAQEARANEVAMSADVMIAFIVLGYVCFLFSRIRTRFHRRCRDLNRIP